MVSTTQRCQLALGFGRPNWATERRYRRWGADYDDQPCRAFSVSSFKGRQGGSLIAQPQGNKGNVDRGYLPSGGGHGELLLKGQYSIKRESPATPVLIKSLREVADRGQIFATNLPQEANSQPVYFKATISDTEASSSLEGTVTSAQTGRYELKITDCHGPLPKDVKITGQTLVMNL